MVSFMDFCVGMFFLCSGIGILVLTFAFAIMAKSDQKVDSVGGLR